MLIPDLSPLWISLKVSLLATAIVFGVGTSVAYKMYGYRGRARSLIEGILIAPLVLPPTVVGFVLLTVLGKNGALGQILSQWHLSIVFTWYAAVLAAVIVSFPLMYRAALGAFEQIDSLLLDVARIEGASELAVFWYIALPLAIPGILAGAVLTFARALGEFGATLMVAGNIPGQTQTMPMAIYFAVEAGATQEGWFWTIIIVCICLGGIIAVNSRRI
jgi:molybdate transport system permease protein